MINEIKFRDDHPVLNGLRLDFAKGCLPKCQSCEEPYKSMYQGSEQTTKKMF